MNFSKPILFNIVIAVSIPIILIEYRTGYLMLVNQLKISTLKTLHNSTVVTAFYDIGPVKRQKGDLRNQTIYFEWTEPLRYMRNALVVYTDSELFRNHITAVRSDLSAITEIIMVNRSSLWSFHNLPKITKIYNSKYYPKHYPDSLPLYTCLTHAKFDLLSKASQYNIFKTRYFMWLDIGYFRDRKSRHMFHLSQPENFNDLKIAMNQVKDMNKSLNPNIIVKTGHRSIGSGLIYGERERVILFAKDFKRAVRYFLSKKIINAEEPILYAMFTENGKQIFKPNIELQLYRKAVDMRIDWHYLGNSMIS